MPAQNQGAGWFMSQLGQTLAPWLRGKIPGWMGANADPGQFLLHNLLTPGTPYHEQMAQLVAQVEQGGGDFAGALQRIGAGVQQPGYGGMEGQAGDIGAILGGLSGALGAGPTTPTPDAPRGGSGRPSSGSAAYGVGSGQHPGQGGPFVHPSMANVPAGVTPPPGAAAYRLNAQGQHEFRIRGPGGSVWVPYQPPAAPAGGADPSGGPVVEAPEPGPVFEIPGNQKPPPMTNTPPFNPNQAPPNPTPTTNNDGKPGVGPGGTPTTVGGSGTKGTPPMDPGSTTGGGQKFQSVAMPQSFAPIGGQPPALPTTKQPQLQPAQPVQPKPVVPRPGNVPRGSLPAPVGWRR